MKIAAHTLLTLALTFALTPINSIAQMNNQTAIQEINAEAFIQLWDEFAGKFTENGKMKEDWLKKWESNKGWTEGLPVLLPEL